MDNRNSDRDDNGQEEVMDKIFFYIILAFLFCFVTAATILWIDNLLCKGV